MIVPMKKVTLLALASEQERALEVLRDLGVMQVELVGSVESENSQLLAEKLDGSRRVLAELGKLAGDHAVEAAGAREELSGAAVLERAAALIERCDQVVGELDSVRQRLRALEVWGDFRRDSLEELRRKGVFVTLCAGSRAQFEEAAKLEQAECREIGTDGVRVFFAVVTLTEPEAGTLPEVRLGREDDPPQLRIREAALVKEYDSVLFELTKLSGAAAKAAERVTELDAELEYAQVHDALSAHGAVVSLRGFVPEPEIERLRAAAKAEGWGLLIVDPAAGEQVPTLLRESKFTKLISPLFSFLGISPGYDEIDVSGGVLVFFTIFYAMIVGDAGYGLVFLLGALFAKWKFRDNPAAKTPVRLLTILSVATIVWGLMTSNIFGCPAPSWLAWAQVPALNDTAFKDQNTQCFCFILAVAQLSLGRIWRAIHDGNLRSILRNVGWMLVIWANFFLTIRLIVYPGDFPGYMYWLYGVGLLLVICCDVDWKNPADIFQFPFNIIGSFVDVLSYIRLFAVGMAGYYIATSFNDMGTDICRISPFLLIGGVAVILFGHLLNLALCVMSVMVHGVRLNTLEFSNHIGLRWAGSRFKPFKNITKSEEN